MEQQSEEQEVWVPIPGVPSYEVSSLGRVRGPKGIRSLKPSPDGYVRLPIPRRKFHKTVHSLVAEAFIGPRPDMHCVNHKNWVRHDNRASNLEWVTYSRNLMHRPGLEPIANFEKRLNPKGPPKRKARGEAHGLSKYTAEQVRSVHRLHAEGKWRRQISEATGVSYIAVCDILAARRWPEMHPDFKPFA